MLEKATDSRGKKSIWQYTTRRSLLYSQLEEKASLSFYRLKGPLLLSLPEPRVFPVFGIIYSLSCFIHGFFRVPAFKNYFRYCGKLHDTPLGKKNQRRKSISAWHTVLTSSAKCRLRACLEPPMLQVIIVLQMSPDRIELEKLQHLSSATQKRKCKEFCSTSFFSQMHRAALPSFRKIRPCKKGRSRPRSSVRVQERGNYVRGEKEKVDGRTAVKMRL